MKILMFPYDLVVSGTTINAIELAAALRNLHGLDVVLFATPGPMQALVREKGLRLLEAPEPRIYPSPARMCALREAVRSERPDLIHVWDWHQCLEAYYSVHLPMRIPMVVTDMSMTFMRLLPKYLPTTFGTPELADKARFVGRRPVGLLLPAVDIKANELGSVDREPFRCALGIGDSDIALVTVSRLDDCMKGESLFRTLDVVRTLARDLPLRFVIVGDGPARGDLTAQANDINFCLGRHVVDLTGALVDPRPAYAAADIIVGMGGSALRGMAFEKPVVVVGEKGFSAPLTPETAEWFYYHGIYGQGDGSEDNEALRETIRSLAERPESAQALGQFSHRFVVEHFDLEKISASFVTFCREAVAVSSLRILTSDAIRTAAVYFRERRFLQLRRGRVRNLPLRPRVS